MPRKPAGPDPTPSVRARWDKCVSAAYLRIIGGTQAEAAKAVGVNERTIREWESAPEWPDARAEAAERWLADATDAARGNILRAVRGDDAQTARWLLERTVPALLPPAQRQELTGKDGTPLEVIVTRRIVRPAPETGEAA